jgi:hypothetical protein
MPIILATQEDSGSKPIQVNSSQDPTLEKKTLPKKKKVGANGVVQGVGPRPWVQTPVLQKKKRGERFLISPFNTMDTKKYKVKQGVYRQNSPPQRLSCLRLTSLWTERGWEEGLASRYWKIEGTRSKNWGLQKESEEATLSSHFKSLPAPFKINL